MMTLCRHSTRARSDPRLTTKPKAKLTVLVVGIVVLVMIGTVAEIGSSGDTVETGAITDNKKSQSQAATRPEDADSTFEATPNSENCLSEGLLETHPMIMDEIKRLDPFLINSESMAVYRGLTELQLLPLVDQGDSGAMAVLGAMHVMRFRGLPDSSAIPYLLLEDLGLLTFRYSRPFSEEQSKHLKLAADWFYRSAINGRVMALINVGNQLDMMGKKPVDLGWISAEEYEQLTRSEKSLFNAANVYQAVAFTIAPELELGPYDENGGFSTMFAQRYADIAEPIAVRFRDDRRKLGLEPLIVPKTELPTVDELKKLLCDPAIE